jgi:hypothetical protein
MTKSTSIPVSNTTASGKALGLTALGLGTNYAAGVSNSGNTVVLTNSTTDFDTSERIVLTFRDLPRVDTKATSELVKDSAGVQYAFETSDFFRTTWTEEEGESSCCCTEDSYETPIVIKTTIRHARTGDITAALVEQALVRHFSVMYNNAGTARINDFMRGNLTHED